MTARIVLVVSVMFWFLRAALCAAWAFVSVIIKFQQAFIKMGAFGRVLTWGWTSVSVTGYLAVTEPVVAPLFVPDLTLAEALSVFDFSDRVFDGFSGFSGSSGFSFSGVWWGVKSSSSSVLEPDMVNSW